MTIKFTTPIRELAKEGIISPRSHNTCIANGIDNVRDLDHYYQPDKGFLGFRNCGTKTNSQLSDVLRMAHSGDTAECAESFVAALPSEVVSAISDAIAKILPASSDILESRHFHSLFTDDTFIYLLYHEREKILARIKDVASSDANRKTSAMEQYAIRKGILEVVTTAVDILSGNFDTYVRRERSFLKKLRSALEVSLRTDYVAGYYAAILSSKKMRLAEKEYERLCSSASRIAQNFIRKYYIEPDDVWALLNLAEDEFFRRYPSSRKGGIVFVQILADFKKYIDYLTKTTDEEDDREELKSIFPFLSDKDAGQVAAFRDEHGYLPMLFITDRYFATTELRRHKIFARCFGLGGNSAKRKTEVADELGVSRERVRQIISDTDFRHLPIADGKYWKRYGFERIEFVSYKSAWWRLNMVREGVPPVFTAIAGIMVGFHGFIFKRMAGVDKFVVRPDRMESYAGYLKQMLDLRDRTHVEDKLLQLSELMTPGDYTDKVMRHTVLNELAGYLELETLGESIFFPHNSVDIATEVENMLRKQGNPLHIDEILDRMNLMFPDLGLTKDRLKFQMRSSDEIVPKGKTSMYCLQSWTHVFIGSIRDLVKQILCDSPEPVSMEDIMKVVAENFDTTRYNVYNSLLICSDFVLFDGGKFGLASKEYSSEYNPGTRLSTRKTFSERFEEYKAFVEKTGHHPYNSGVDEEESLKRWQVNVMKELIGVLPDEKESLMAYIRNTKDIPFTAIEHSFKTNCENYLSAYKTTGCAPEAHNEPDLVKWYRKQIKCYTTYKDRRRSYFEDMLEEINTLDINLFNQA